MHDIRRSLLTAAVVALASGSTIVVTKYSSPSRSLKNSGANYMRKWSDTTTGSVVSPGRTKGAWGLREFGH